VASFKSTLDEVRDAQLLLHVVDFSHPDYRGQMQTARELLGEIAAGGKDQLLVFNKIDRVEDAEALAAARLAFPQAVFVSCKQGTGLDALRQAIVTAYEAHLKAMRVHLSYAQAGMMAEIRKSALVVHASYEPERIVLDLRVWPERREHLKRVLKTAVILQDAPS
ncbi:MAG: GTPase HflX, partial [Nitrospinaceae bacterium]